MKREFKIGKHLISNNTKPFIIVEARVNHQEILMLQKNDPCNKKIRCTMHKISTSYCERRNA